MNDKKETPESIQLNALDDRKVSLERDVRVIETNRRHDDKIIQGKRKEIEMLEYLIAKLKEREEKIR